VWIILIPECGGIGAFEQHRRSKSFRVGPHERRNRLPEGGCSFSRMVFTRPSEQLMHDTADEVQGSAR